MRKYGIPEKLLKMVKLFYDGFQCAVEEQGEIGEWFDVTTGVKQGCNMSEFIAGLGHEKNCRGWQQWH